MLEEERAKLENGNRIEKESWVKLEAIKRLADVIRRSVPALAIRIGPLVSFIFLGPTGVGKTELTKALGAFMFNDDRALIRSICLNIWKGIQYRNFCMRIRGRLR